jgi:hypothetical protein
MRLHHYGYCSGLEMNLMPALSTAFYVPGCPALISEPPQDIISALAGRRRKIPADMSGLSRKGRSLALTATPPLKRSCITTRLPFRKAMMFTETAARYQGFAAECLDLATSLGDPTERSSLLDTAQLGLALARLAQMIETATWTRT